MCPEALLDSRVIIGLEMVDAPAWFVNLLFIHIEICNYTQENFQEDLNIHNIQTDRNMNGRY